jgi:hypothetical protein
MDHPYLDLFLTQELVGLQPSPPEDEFARRCDPDGVEQAELLDAGRQAPEVAQVLAEGLADDDVLDLAPCHDAFFPDCNRGYDTPFQQVEESRR